MNMNSLLKVCKAYEKLSRLEKTDLENVLVDSLESCQLTSLEPIRAFITIIEGATKEGDEKYLLRELEAVHSNISCYLLD